jgi:hypothetical protein
MSGMFTPWSAESPDVGLSHFIGLPHILGHGLSWLSVVVIAVALLLVVSAAPLQACPSENSATSEAAPARPFAVPIAPQTVSNSSDRNVTLPIDHRFCCGSGFGHSVGDTCANSCCVACSADIILGDIGVQDFIRFFQTPFAEPILFSAELSAEFRPPDFLSDRTPA